MLQINLHPYINRKRSYKDIYFGLVNQFLENNLNFWHRISYCLHHASHWSKLLLAHCLVLQLCFIKQFKVGYAKSLDFLHIYYMLDCKDDIGIHLLINLLSYLCYLLNFFPCLLDLLKTILDFFKFFLDLLKFYILFFYNNFESFHIFFFYYLLKNYILILKVFISIAILTTIL